MSSVVLPDPERTRRTVGLVLLVLALLVGSALLFFQLLIPPLFDEEKGPMVHYASMLVGAGLAIPAGAMYLTVPRLLDRYDPEPWYALTGCLLWGGICATSFSIPFNELAGAVSEVFAIAVVAPVVEEAWKGLCVLAVFYFLRREFDGVVDGIIYATFTAIGFAAVENVIYYAKAVQESQDAFATVLFLRGVLGPWGHPLYTSMTGIGVGLARESKSGLVRFVAPVLGYCGAVLLHMLWNGSAVLGSVVGPAGGVLFLLMLPIWLIFVAAFLVIVIVLVRRRGRVIREYLVDEVALGTVSREEVDLVCSAFGAVRARLRWGATGVDFVRAIARLALSKWHTSRAMDSRTHTVSYDFIVPLRQKIGELRRHL
jgi:RsiW-degrading membrane proteinase PrsW (M82 family)